MLAYTAVVTKEGKYLLAEFPDCPGCQTFAKTRRELETNAREALEGRLNAEMDRGNIPSHPQQEWSAGSVLVEVDILTEFRLQVKRARAESGLTQAELAKLSGVSQQQIAKLEARGGNPAIATVDKILRVMGSGVGFMQKKESR